MTINRKRLVSSATHFPNGKKQHPDGKGESDKVLVNHQDACELLFDPRDVKPGATHSAKPLKASTEVDEDLDVNSLDELMPAGGDDIESALYDEEDDGDDVELEAEEGVSETIFDDSNDELVEALDDEEVGDEPLDPVETLEPVEADIEEIPEDVVEDNPGEDLEGEECAEGEICGSDDGIPLVDVDGVEDEIGDTETLQFASVGSTLHCMRANRIIASMTKTQAVKASKADLYNTDEFCDVVRHEIETVGLRAGLKQQGFRLATVDLKGQKAVTAAVTRLVAAKEVKLAKQTELVAQRMEQCMSIAAVGINRNFFKGHPNTLRAALEDELKAAGVRGASKLIASMFAQHGVDYARSLVVLAQNLAEQPDEVREKFVEALDMTDDQSIEADDDDDDEDDFDPDEDDSDAEVPTSVTAALARPGVATRVKASAQTQSRASEVLAGTKPLPFL